MDYKKEKSEYKTLSKRKNAIVEEIQDLKQKQGKLEKELIESQRGKKEKNEELEKIQAQIKDLRQEKISIEESLEHGLLAMNNYYLVQKYHQSGKKFQEKEHEDFAMDWSYFSRKEYQVVLRALN